MAALLYPVPTPGEGPGGLIVCSTNFLTFKSISEQPDIRVPIPMRKGDLSDPERGNIIVAHAALKTKQFTFFLVQTDQGDLFKVTLEYSDQPDDVSVCAREHGTRTWLSSSSCLTVGCLLLWLRRVEFLKTLQVVDMSIKYFDTIPVASSLCLLKNGFLFCASEFSNQYVYTSYCFVMFILIQVAAICKAWRWTGEYQCTVCFIACFKWSMLLQLFLSDSEPRR